jgi:gas vesicle protein
MSGFTRGLLIGVGVGLLVAPMRGEDMRRLLAERINTIRASLPENEQVNQYVRQVSDRVSQTSSSLKDYAQQAASKVKETGGTLSGLAQQAGATVKQTGQDVSDTTKQAIKSASTSKQ